MTRVCIGGVAAAVAIAGAGCGADDRVSRGRYEHGFRAALARFKQRGASLQAEAGNPSRSARVQALEDVRLLVLRTDDELARLKPPAEVRDAHDRLVRSVRAYAAGPAKRAVAAFRRGDDKRGQAILGNPAEQPVGPLSDAQRARDEFRKKGYDIGPVDELLP
jgi:hypothetical protein